MTHYFGKKLAAALFSTLLIIGVGCKGKPSAEKTIPPPSPGPAAKAPEGPAVALSKEIKNRIEDIIRQNYSNLPPQVSFTFGSVISSEVQGLLKGEFTMSLQGQTQSDTFYITQDKRFLVLGRAFDISEDPFLAIMKKIDLTDVPSRGPEKAKVTIVEYSDFQCPFCSRAYATIEGDVLKKYGKKVRFVYKHFPLTNLHPWAESAAIGAECAYIQKKNAFWDIYNDLYKNQSSITLQNLREKLLEYAKKAGLKIDAFTACVDSQATRERVNKQIQEATAVGVRSTPSFFVNGRALIGAQPADKFEAVIKKELSR